MINLLEHNASGATIRLDQRELLLVMALIQEGRRVLRLQHRHRQSTG